ncbi:MULTISPECIES: hypothetical protein [unclassified Streptomyces]|uniref:hypothetical protein n=1 Tax=unclassified Streptomyces TaxID=2593676 RepID=UPI002366200D|nr:MULTISPECIES: hypothetical protein [unclassified Streptomyces]MDF3141304.1 hypothetical protein [Streptomyces sp. T21Q-yed]WDF45006.1 hypothetical protein PBV52_44055 [Streptomyces sp. T12]
MPELLPAVRAVQLGGLVQLTGDLKAPQLPKLTAFSRELTMPCSLRARIRRQITATSVAIGRDGAAADGRHSAALPAQCQRAGLSDVPLVDRGGGGYLLTSAVPKHAARMRRLVVWSAFVPNDGWVADRGLAAALRRDAPRVDGSLRATTR